MTCISNQQARRLALHQQGLLSAKPKFGRGKKAVLKAIEQLGYVQIDAISVIQRAHHHTLWSRVPGYQPNFLYKLLSQDRSIFEYWSHAVAFLPMKDYLYVLPLMKLLTEKDKHWYQVDKEFKSQVLERIRDEGPLYARDFETPKGNNSGMWSWKPAKKALHELFMEGNLTVRSRDSFQRLYDLPERVIPILQTPTQTQTSLSAYIWHRCQQAIKAHGVVTIPEIRYQRPISSGQVSSVLQDKHKKGLILPVEVKGSRALYFTIPELLEGIPSRAVRQLHFLSPFDNAVIQRKRVQDLFGFNYQTEIYYPVNKRKYGYFSLPILYGTEFIGRMDPKAHRETGILEVRNLAIEPGVKIDDKLVEAFKNRLSEFASFNNCNNIRITRSSPDFLKSVLC